MTSTANFTLKSIKATAFRYPLSTPVVTSFGRMTNRPAVFVRVEDHDGHVGWGEVWCNFPSPGAEHRVRLLNEILADAITGFSAAHPSDVFDKLTTFTAVLALQSGEPGPFAQAISGIDLAIWDLFGRRQGKALWQLLGGAGNRIKVYASGINPTGTAAIAERALAAGHRALKLKIGFDPKADRDNLAALRRLIPDGMLATDVNQGWTLEQALALAPQLEPFGLAWLEEPLRADRPREEWTRLRAAAGVPPLAAGENITGMENFAQALDEPVLSVVQPDIAKWGGLSLCSTIATSIRAAGKTFCPHYLGAGLGLLASAHLLAGVGGDGLLEVDCNENPLRDELSGPVAQVRDGMIELTDAPGLGIEPDFTAFEKYRVA